MLGPVCASGVPEPMEEDGDSDGNPVQQVGIDSLVCFIVKGAFSSAPFVQGAFVVCFIVKGAFLICVIQCE
jgi:hypothetical protein